MRNKIKKYALIVENNKELKDYIDILNKMSLMQNLSVKIVLLAEVYQDMVQYNTIKKIKFHYKILNIKNDYNIAFVKLSVVKKIILVLKNKNNIFNFVKDVDILLSGVQTVFERVLYSQIKKNHLPIEVIVYHRHLLFDDNSTTQKKMKGLNFFKKFLFILGLEGFLIDIKAVGFADKYIVLGNINKQYLMSKGILDKIIHPLGSLEYDSIHLIKPKPLDVKKSVCYITGACEWINDLEGESYQYRKIIEYCEFFQDKLEKYNIWIRVHPREPVEKYYKIKEKYRFIHLQFMSDNPLLVDINQFDILIGGVSTVMFEASLLKKELIFFLLDEEFYRYKTILNIENIKVATYLSNDKIQGNIQSFNVISYSRKEKSLDRISYFLLGIK